MWLYTQHGHFSVVRSTTHRDEILVRSRRREHLENLLKASQLRRKIKSTPKADYAYRIVIPVQMWTDLLLFLGSDVDYGNFKSRVAERRQAGTVDDAYMSACHKVYHVAEENLKPKMFCTSCGDVVRATYRVLNSVDYVVAEELCSACAMVWLDDDDEAVSVIRTN